MPTCRFGCDADKLTDEHIFSRAWVKRVAPLPVGERLVHRHERRKGQKPFGADGKDGFELEWKAIEASLTVSGVCEVCNNGWMNDMDKATYPNIDPLVAGHARRLDLGAQAQIARWATKIAILFDSQLGVPGLPPEIWPTFRKTQQPIPDSHIWLGRYDLPPGTWIGGGTPTTKSMAPPDGPTDAYLCGFYVNDLIGVVLIPVAGFDVLPYARAWEKAWGGHVRRIWPPLPGGPVEWPPVKSVTPDEYLKFASAEEPP